jgi:hypothetical protein
MTDHTDRTPTDRGWGPWRLRAEVLSLVAIDPRSGGEHYEVDLERSLTSAETLDWICQVARKGWADDETLAGLVRAIDDVLKPQDTLCSFGKSKEISADQVASLVETAASRWPVLVRED